MKVKAFTFNPFGEMTYVVYDEATGQAAVVDPGMVSEAEQKQISQFIDDNNLSIRYLINTHLHLDHSFGNGFIEYKYGVGTSANLNDRFLGQSIDEQARRFRLPIDTRNVTIVNPIAGGDVLPLGNESLEVIETPGHSPGSICLYCPSGNFLMSGDTLFQRSVGRTDLAGGNAQDLFDSIRNKLFNLPPQTVVYPGHGPQTTIGDEIRANPYV